MADVEGLLRRVATRAVATAVAIDVWGTVEAVIAQVLCATSGVGVKGTSRLISRLRHRQFGVLITTSYLDSQAYAKSAQVGTP
jgi:hypothetical protein